MCHISIDCSNNKLTLLRQSEIIQGIVQQVIKKRYYQKLSTIQ